MPFIEECEFPNNRTRFMKVWLIIKKKTRRQANIMEDIHTDRLMES